MRAPWSFPVLLDSCHPSSDEEDPCRLHSLRPEADSGPRSPWKAERSAVRPAPDHHILRALICGKACCRLLRLVAVSDQQCPFLPGVAARDRRLIARQDHRRATSGVAPCSGKRISLRL